MTTPTTADDSVDGNASSRYGRDRHDAVNRVD